MQPASTTPLVASMIAGLCSHGRHEVRRKYLLTFASSRKPSARSFEGTRVPKLKTHLPALSLGGMAFILTASCNSEATLCPQWIPPPILVEVRDGATRLPAAQGATGWIQNGAYTAPLAPATPSELLVLAATGGPGTYAVVVQKAGYRTWVKDGVYVRGSKCGVDKPATLRADLVPGL